MLLLRLIGNLITTTAWGLAGNWMGEKMRQLATGEPGHQMRFFRTSPRGEVVIAANPLITNLVPAVLVGLVIRPRWLWAFVSGMITAGLMGKRYEDAFIDLLKRQEAV